MKKKYNKASIKKDIKSLPQRKERYGNMMEIYRKKYYPLSMREIAEKHGVSRTTVLTIKKTIKDESTQD